MLALYIVAGIILLIIFILSIPVELAFNFDVHEEARSRIRVGWFFGLIWKDMGRKKKKPEKKKKKWSMRPFLSLLRIEGVPSRLLKLVRQIMRCFKVRQLDADLRIGLDDPADTSMLCFIVLPTLVLRDFFSPVRMRVEPSFDGPVLDVSMHGRVRLLPIRMVGPLLQFVLSLTGLRLAR